jgi:hypothetical protein
MTVTLSSARGSQAIDSSARRVACPYQQGQPDENHAEQQAGQRAGSGKLFTVSS